MANAAQKSEPKSEEEKVRDKILSMVEALVEIDNQREVIKGFAKDLEANHDIKGKISRKAARFIHKGDLQEAEEENAAIKALVTNILK